MQKKIFSLVSAAAAATAALCLALPAGASAHSPAVSGTEHFQFMSTSVTADTGSVIAYGPVTAAATAPIGSQRVGTVVFPQGTITISHQQGKSSVHVNPETCLVTLAGTGTYKILRGSGAYAGITGHGTYRLSIVQIAARVSGTCSQTAPPVASQELLQLSGPVHL